MDIDLRGLPHEDIIQGFPGLPATNPRALGVVIIKPLPKPGAPKTIRPLGVVKVNVSLVRTDSINVSGFHKETMYLLSQQDLYTGDGKQEIYGFELPFVLPIGKSGKISASMTVPERFVQTSHSLFVKVTTKEVIQQPAAKFPVYVRRFDTLSTFSRYVKPVIKNVTSPDHLVNLQCTLTASAFGHGDKILAYFHLSPNPDYSKAKRVKLLRVSLELVQIIQFTKACANEKDKIPETKRTRMAKESYEFHEVYLSDSTVQDIKVTVPNHPPQSSIDRYNVGPPPSVDVPHEGRIGFTNSCAMFDVSFLLVFKARFRHARDIEVTHPVTICEFNHGTCAEYTKSIVQTAELAQYMGSQVMMEQRIQTTAPAMDLKIR